MSNLTFLKSPAALNLTGNPISFRIAGKNAFTGNLVPAHAAFCIIGSTPWVVDKYLRFAYGGKTITFYCRTSPSDSLLEFPSTIQYSELVGYLKKSAELAADYEIVYDVSGITLQARTRGSQFNMIITSDWSAFAAFNPTDSTDHVLNDFYKIGISVEKIQTYMYGQSIYYVVANMELPVGIPVSTDSLPGGFTSTGAGVVQVNIADTLKETINGKFTFPEPDTGWAMIHSGLIKLFRVYAYEKLTGSDIGIYSADYRVIQGKLKNFKQGELNYLDKSLVDLLSESKMFLTWAPLEKTTDIYAPEKLYFLFQTTGTYRLRTKEYYSDDSSAEVTRASFNANAWEIFEFFIGYARVRTNEPKRVIKYEISLLDVNYDLISDVRTYIIDYTYQQYARYFIFKNDFGVYELVRFTGKATKNLNTDKQFVNIPLADNFGITAKEEKQISEDANYTYKINTGFIPDNYWSEWLQEFLLSEDVYWLKRGKAYPVTILNSKNQVSQDGDFNPFQEFELTHAIHDDFTEEFSAHEPIIVGDFNIDFNTDWFTGGTPPEPEPAEFWELPVNEQFSNWANGLPENWLVQNETLVVISNSSNRLRIDIAENNTYYYTGIQHQCDFGGPKNIRVIVKVDEISHDDAFHVDFTEPNQPTVARPLKLGTNTFDLNLAITPLYMLISDQPITQYGGAYPHYITIDYITIEEIV